MGQAKPCAQRAACRPSARRRGSSASSDAIAAASATSSRGGTSTPVTPSWIVVASPPTREATTARAARHGLERRHPERLVVRGHEAQIGGAIVLGEGGLELGAPEVDPGADAERVGQRAQARPLVVPSLVAVAAHDHQTHVGPREPVGLQARERSQEDSRAP